MRHHRGRRFGSIVVLGMLLLPAVAVFAADTVTVPLFPGEVFYRDPGKPTAVVRAFTVPAVQGTFTLHVTNGDGATDNLASSAVIRVNGSTLVRPSDLNQHVATLDRPLSNLVKGNNTIEVEVRSIPSSYISVSVAGTYLLGLRVSDPLSGASESSDRVTVQGTCVGYTSDVGVVVNGVPAVVSGSSFVAEDVTLVPGSNTLTATVTTFDGVRNTDAVTVSATGAKPAIFLWANFASGVPPLTVTFRPEVEGIEPVEYRYDFDRDGVLDNTVSAGDVLSFTYVSPGSYRATVTAVDAAGMEYSAEKTVVVQDRGTMDALLSGRWNALSTSLQVRDVEGSMSFLLPESREKYRSIFTPLSAQLPTVFASVSPPELIRVEGNMAQYRVKREQLWEGVRRTVTYYVWFDRDEDGVWRIDRF